MHTTRQGGNSYSEFPLFFKDSFMKKWMMVLACMGIVNVMADASTVTQDTTEQERATAPNKRQRKSQATARVGTPKKKRTAQPKKKGKGVPSQPIVAQKKEPTTAGGQLINKIAVIIYVTAPSQPGSDKQLEKVSDIVITLLDVERPSIDGRLRTLDELILDKLLFFEATYFYRMVISDEAIDKYINSIKEHYGIGDEQLREMFKQAGYTYDEGREQLAASQAVDGLLNFKIRSRLVVPEKEIRDYYDAHPEYEEGSYKIKKAFIPDGVLTPEELASLNDSVTAHKSIEWSMTYWLSEDEMTDERKATLQAAPVGGYTQPEQVTGGYEVIKVLAAKPRAVKSFEDSYREITAKLQEPQYFKMLEEFKKELFAKYEIVYL